MDTQQIRQLIIDELAKANFDISNLKKDVVPERLKEPTSRTKIDPGFVNDFQCRDFAIMCINMVVDFQRAGKSYTKMVEYPGLIKLFNDKWSTKSKKALAIKLKNMVRDLRESNQNFHDEWVEARRFFIARKRK